MHRLCQLMLWKTFFHPISWIDERVRIQYRHSLHCSFNKRISTVFNNLGFTRPCEAFITCINKQKNRPIWDNCTEWLGLQKVRDDLVPVLWRSLAAWSSLLDIALLASGLHPTLHGPSSQLPPRQISEIPQIVAMEILRQSESTSRGGFARLSLTWSSPFACTRSLALPPFSTNSGNSCTQRGKRRLPLSRKVYSRIKWRQRSSQNS